MSLLSLCLSQKNTVSQAATAKVGPKGALVVTFNGAEKTVVPRDAVKAWILKDGRTVVYSFRERKRGYEGEGEGLFRYDPANERRTQILAEDYMVDKVYELTTTGGKTLLCVTMSDGGLGADHVAIVNPERGAVFARRMSRFVKVEPEQIVIAEWGDARRWESGSGPTGRPTRYFTFMPDRVLGQRAVHDRPWR